MADRNPENVALFSRPQSTYSARGEAYNQPQRDQQGQYDQQYQDDHKPLQVRNMRNVYLRLVFRYKYLNVEKGVQLLVTLSTVNNQPLF